MYLNLFIVYAPVELYLEPCCTIWLSDSIDCLLTWWNQFLKVIQTPREPYVLSLNLSVYD